MKFDHFKTCKLSCSFSDIALIKCICIRTMFYEFLSHKAVKVDQGSLLSGIVNLADAV